MMTGVSGSFPRKAYLRPAGKGLNSIGGLGGRINSSNGSFLEGSASSSMKNLASSYNSGFTRNSREAALNSSNGS